MVKLSDYLGYLYTEVIQARKQADRLAIQTAKEYAGDDYLKFFKAPRYTMPSVKLEVPIKITEMDSRVKYNFKMDNDTFLFEVNNKIDQVNATKGMNIRPFTQGDVETEAFKQVISRLEKSDQKYIKDKESDINKIDLSSMIKTLYKKDHFIKADEGSDDGGLILNNIIREALINRYTPVSADLKNLFIDPNTMTEEDKGKLMVKLNIEFVEEGVQIRSGKDKNGNMIEEIMID